MALLIRTQSPGPKRFTKRSVTCPTNRDEKEGTSRRLRSRSDAILLLKLVEVMPPWFSAELGGMLVWQWAGLGFLVVLLTTVVVGAVAWIGRRWKDRNLPAPVGRTAGAAGPDRHAFLSAAS